MVAPRDGIGKHKARQHKARVSEAGGQLLAAAFSFLGEILPAGGSEAPAPQAAAVVNALCDALSPACVEDLPMPATPQVIWNKVRGSGSN